MNSSNENKKQILLVIVGAILLAGLIFLLVLSLNKGGKPGDDRPGGRGGQPVRPTGPAPPGAPSPTVPIDPEDPNGKNVTPTPGGGNGGNTTPTPGGGNGGDTTPTPGGGNGGDTTPTPGGGNGGDTTPTPGGGNGGDTTPTPDGRDGGDTTPTPGGGNGEDTTPTPSGGNGGNTTPTPGGGNGGNTTPTPSGGNGGKTTPTPGGGNGGNTTPTPTRIPGWDVTPTPTAGPDGPTPTPRIGGPTPIPKPSDGGGGRTTPTPTPYGGGNDKPAPTYYDPDGGNGGDSGLNALDIAKQDDSNLRSGVNFGDDRWDLYINGLFERVSPDYSVDALTTLDIHGQELFMQMAEQFGTGKVTRAAQTVENQKIWDQITEEIHKATNRSQLEEIIIKYSLRFSQYRKYEPGWNTFNNGLYASDDARRTALLKSDCYMIVVGMQERMPDKGLGYSWNEALTVVLRESGNPMAQAAESEDDIELFMKLGRIFDGTQFDKLDYVQKKLWWSIEEEVNKAQDIERLEELIVLYKANAQQRATFQAILDKYPEPEQAKTRRTEVQASQVYKDLIGTVAAPGKLRKNFAIMGTQYATWEDALAAVLKNRVTVGGDVNAGGQKTETTLIE